MRQPNPILVTPTGREHDCSQTCPAGGKCACSDLVVHTLHVCSDPRCWCHSQARYLGAPFVVANIGGAAPREW